MKKLSHNCAKIKIYLLFLTSIKALMADNTVVPAAHILAAGDAGRAGPGVAGSGDNAHISCVSLGCLPGPLEGLLGPH